MSRNTLAPIVLALAGLVAATALSAEQSPKPTFSARSELVVVRVSVSQRDHGPIAGLPKDAFIVYEDNMPQPIPFFSNEDEPVTVGLVIDNSGSMGAKRGLVAAASMEFAKSSNRKDELFLVNFNEHVRFGLPADMKFTSSLSELEEALARTLARGKTGLYDAVSRALEHLDHGSRSQKALVVLSDGQDNASGTTLETMLSKAEDSDAVIYSVGLFAPQDPEGNPGVLKKLAKASGGEAFLLREVDEVGPVLQTIARDIRNSYTIGYVPTSLPRDGEFRELRVSVRTPRQNRVDIRSRTGYKARKGGSATAQRVR